MSSETRNRKFGRVAAVAEVATSSNDARSARSRVMVGSGGVMDAGAGQEVGMTATRRWVWEWAASMASSMSDNGKLAPTRDREAAVPEMSARNASAV